MQGAIDELKALGRMPDSTDCEPPGNRKVLLLDRPNPNGRFEELLAKVKLPLTAEEVGVLMRTFPESTMYEVEWGLLRLVESYAVSNPGYRQLIDICPSGEWRETMTVRFENWETKKLI